MPLKSIAIDITSFVCYTIREVKFMTQLNITLDDTIKTKGEQYFSDLGLSFSEGVNALIACTLEKSGYPLLYARTNDPFYSPENIKEIKQRLVDIDSGKTTLTPHELIEVEDD
jgi:DNA-damage-inducible protein J